MLNSVAIMGRLVADPTMRQTTTGKPVASFRIACDRGRKDASGKNQADFFEVTAWNNTAELVSKYFQKGSLIVVSGRMATRAYQDKNGQNRTVTEIVAAGVSFCERSANYSPDAKRTAQRDSGPSYAPAAGSPDVDDYAPIDDVGDLPF